MKERGFVYAAIIMGALAIALDFASVDLALPSLENQFGLDLDSVQWVINGYVLAFSVLMVAGGKMADAYGRKLVFLIGMGIFALASLLGGMAWNGSSVIFFRVLQGVGAALLWPAMIGMACAAVGEARRGVALGLIFGSCSLGNAAGPVVGGALTEWLSWRWVLWINVPMALLAMGLTWAKVPNEASPGEHPKNDWPGMTVLTAGLVAMMIMVYQAQGWGWGNAKTLGLAAAAAVLLAVFPALERKAAEPVIPPDLMRNREFLTLCLSSVAICQLFFIVLLYFTQYAMKFLGDDPMMAGLRVVPFMLSYGVVSYFGGPLYARFGARTLLSTGMISAILASILLAICGPGASWLPYNGALILLGIGVGAVIPNISSRAIETVGVAKAGLVSGITFMAQLSGSALMLAIGTAIFTALSSGSLEKQFRQEGMVLSDSQWQTVAQIMSGPRTLHGLPPQTVEQVRDLAGILSEAYRAGLQTVLWVSAGLVGLALFLVLRHVPRQVFISEKASSKLVSSES